MRRLSIVLIGLMASVLTACGDAKVERFEDVNPSETAFLIPVEGESLGGQAQLDSAEALNKRKVSAKRISLEQRKKSTGYLWTSYEWIPTQRVVKVDRAQVAREWVEGDGPAAPKAGFHVESLDSIGFSVGAALICHIEEEDAAQHLYHFGGRSLTDVMDTAMRTWLLGQLTQRFGSHNLTECIRDKVLFVKEVETEAKTYWKVRGVTVDSFTMCEGIRYENEKVQETLDAKFIAENDLQVQKKLNEAQTEKNLLNISKLRGDADAAAGALRAKAENDAAIAEAELKAQQVRNQIDIVRAETAKKVADLYAAAADGIRIQVDAEVRRMQAEANLAFARAWKGDMPASVIPADSPLLFGLGGPEKK